MGDLNANATLEENRSLYSNSLFIGEVKAWAGFALPDDFLWCDGTSYSGSANGGYNQLALAIGFAYGFGGGPGTISYTASSSIVTCTTTHGLSVGDVVAVQTYVHLGLSTGDYPGLSSNATPLVVESVPSTTTFTLTTILGGGALTSSSTRSGDGWYSAFRVPDLRDRQIVGRDEMGTAGDSSRIASGNSELLGNSSGAEKHTDVPAHTHEIGGVLNSASGSNRYSPANHPGSIQYDTSETGEADGVNHMDPYQVLNYIIRYK